jgi:hypothetical protein
VAASGNRDALVNNDYHNFAPRVGFAYDLDGKGTTVVRGGGGIFYFLDRGGISNQLAQNPPFSGIQQYNYTDGYRITLSGAAPLSSNNWMAATGLLPARGFENLNLADPQNVAVTAIKPDNSTSMMEQWNFQVQRELPKNIVVSAAYVGAAGRHLIDEYNLAEQIFNQPAGVHLYPGMGAVNVEEARGISMYHSMQIEAQHRWSNGLQFTASYTFSKTIDDGSGAFGANGNQIYQALRLDRALADTDQRNRFIFSGVYELPFGHGKRFFGNVSKLKDYFIGGWQFNTVITVESGLPFTLSTPGSPGTARPDLVGQLKTYAGNTQQYFNINAVQEAPLNSSGVLLRQGTLGRNTLIGPGLRGADIGMQKTISLTERFKLTIRAEAFNVTNHPEYSDPTTDITSSTFGQITSTRPSSERQLQGVARLSF